MNLRISNEGKQYQEEINRLQVSCRQLSLQLERGKNDSQLLIVEKQQKEQLISTMKQYQNRFELLAGQIERLNLCLRDKSKELNEHYMRGKQLGDEKKFYQEQNTELELKLKNILVDLSNLEKQNRQIWVEKSTLEERESLIFEYESRI